MIRTAFRCFLAANLLLIVLLMARAWRGGSEPPAVAGPAPAIMKAVTPALSFTDQFGRSSDLSQLRGRPWLVQFMYTRCPSQCPQMNQRLTALSRSLPTSIGFLSVSSDPAHDTPETLAAYAEQWDVADRTWLFARADSVAVSELAGQLLLPGVDKPEMHSLRWTLLDERGVVVGSYDSEDPSHIKRLLKDAEAIR
ncbi:MAG: hypothetical protein MOGMAGMI_00952 [Candidatus Omnitrophica bacterium]|nr:hypothetical protein [Candidatus Omnitrophota bacterium]